MKHDMTRPTMPWWRVPVVWLVVGGPALVVAASIATLVIAVRGGDAPLRDMQPRSVQQPGPLVPATQARNHAAAPRR
jgi:hypothetical protein